MTTKILLWPAGDIPADLISLVLMGSDLACFFPTSTCARDPGQQENRDGATARVLV